MRMCFIAFLATLVAASAHAAHPAAGSLAIPSLIASAAAQPGPSLDARRAQADAIAAVFERHGLAVNSSPSTSDGMPVFILKQRNSQTSREAIRVEKYAEGLIFASEPDALTYITRQRRFMGNPVDCRGCEEWANGSGLDTWGVFRTGVIVVTVHFMNLGGATDREREDWKEKGRVQNPPAVRTLIQTIVDELRRLDLDGPAVSSPRRPEPPTRPEPPSPARDACAGERERLVQASLRANLAAYHLQSVRSAVEELNREWEARRTAAYWSGTIDVAFMAGSLLSKPAAALVGVQVAKQQLVTQIVEAGIKGVVKNGLKKFPDYCGAKGIAPADVLGALEKGGENAGKKVLDEFVTEFLTQDIMSKLVAEEAGGMTWLQAAIGNVDQTMRGGSEVTAFVRAEYAAPIAALAGVLVSLQSTIDSAWTAHNKLEALRLALVALRGQELKRNQRWEQMRQEFDLARSSFNYCRQLHPESPDQPLGKNISVPPPASPGGAGTADRDARGGEVGRTAVSAGNTMPLPLDLAVITLVDGHATVTSVKQGSNFAENGLVVGAKFVAIDEQLIDGLSMAQIKEWMTLGQGRAVTLRFVRPDGQTRSLTPPRPQ